MYTSFSEHSIAVIKYGSSVTIVCKEDESIKISAADSKMQPKQIALFPSYIGGGYPHGVSMDGRKCSVDHDHVIRNAKAVCDKKTSCTLFGDDEMFRNQCNEFEVNVKVMYLCVKTE